MNQHVDPTIYLVEQLLAAVERRSLKLAELAATVERISGRVEQLEAERAQADAVPGFAVDVGSDAAT